MQDLLKVQVLSATCCLLLLPGCNGQQSPIAEKAEFVIASRTTEGGTEEMVCLVDRATLEETNLSEEEFRREMEDVLAWNVIGSLAHVIWGASDDESARDQSKDEKVAVSAYPPNLSPSMRRLLEQGIQVQARRVIGKAEVFREVTLTTEGVGPVTQH